MSDLINREDVIKCLQENGWLDDTNIDELIETIPTAYSVDKVVEMLNRETISSSIKESLGLLKAIEIVKQGGVSEAEQKLKEMESDRDVKH